MALFFLSIYCFFVKTVYTLQPHNIAPTDFRFRSSAHILFRLCRIMSTIYEPFYDAHIPCFLAIVFRISFRSTHPAIPCIFLPSLPTSLQNFLNSLKRSCANAYASFVIQRCERRCEMFFRRRNFSREFVRFETV